MSDETKLIRVSDFPTESLAKLQAHCRAEGIDDSESTAVRYAAVQFAKSLPDAAAPSKQNPSGAGSRLDAVA